MPSVEAVFFLLTVITALVLLSRRLQQPYPILLVLGGLALGFLPGVPDVAMRPDLVFLVFLPPLLFVESLNTSWRDFRNNLRPILLLSIGLVLMTATAVAVVAHALIPRLTWPAAFVLGAVVAPTDTVATGAIAEKLKLPRRIVSVLEGESLVNDATALVIYGIALGAASGDSFSLLRAVGEFARVSAVGIGVGLAAGWLIGEIRRRLPKDPPVENTVSLLTPLTAYLPAEWLHVSGVLSVVACGIYLGRLGPRIVSAQTRLQAIAMWQMITYLLNGLLFLLTGLELRQIVQSLPVGRPLGMLIVAALLVGLTAVLTRIAWVFPATYLPRLIPAVRRRDPFPSWRPVAIVAWSGMRGGISLAAALAIPATLSDGVGLLRFPARDALLFVTFGVILITLVGQGLTLPPLIKRLGVVGGREEREEEDRARAHAARAAMTRLDALADGSGLAPTLLEDIRRFYAKRNMQVNARLARADGREAEEGSDDGTAAAAAAEQEGASYLRLKRELLAAERAAIVGLRDDGAISDDTLHRIQKDLDLDQTRIDSLASQSGGRGGA